MLAPGQPLNIFNTDFLRLRFVANHLKENNNNDNGSV